MYFEVYINSAFFKRVYVCRMCVSLLLPLLLHKSCIRSINSSRMAVCCCNIFILAW